jgi:hypothetical protein
MTLSFSQNLNNKPTLFVEKIINCLHYDLKLGSEINNYLLFKEYGYDYAYKLVAAIQKTKAKKHTIRKDVHNRWKASNDIHFAINVRTKEQLQFAPVIKCVSTQAIEIVWNYDNSSQKETQPGVFIDGKEIDFQTLAKLAKNDGFDTVVDFLKYFNSNFTGKIIHWTDLKY